MCPVFCKAWRYEIDVDECGWLNHPSGRSCRVDLHISEYDIHCHMTSGISVCGFFSSQKR